MSVTPGAAAATTGLLGSRSGALEWETTRVSSLTLSGEDRFLELFQKTWFHEDVPTSHHDLLRQAGLRVTAPRLAVLAEVEAAPHSDADTIRNGVSDRLGAVSTQAVYDILRALHRRRDPPARPSPRGHRVGTRSPGGDNHHHLVCRALRGGRRRAVRHRGGAVSARQRRPRLRSLTTAEVTYWGYCPDCLSESA